MKTLRPNWQERAEQYNGIEINTPGHKKRSKWLFLISQCCLSLALRRVEKGDMVIDFGCAAGHHTETLHLHTGHAVGVDITPGMIQKAKTSYGHLPISFELIDGIHLPVNNNSVDLIWVSGVIKYSLRGPNPTHREIADEFFRVLKPGGWICSLEIYVNQPSAYFAKAFIEAGFSLVSASTTNIYRSIFDKLALRKYSRLFMHRWLANFAVWWTRSFVKEQGLDRNVMRDYFFEFQKPLH